MIPPCFMTEYWGITHLCADLLWKSFNGFRNTTDTSYPQASILLHSALPSGSSHSLLFNRSWALEKVIERSFPMSGQFEVPHYYHFDALWVSAVTADYKENIHTHTFHILRMMSNVIVVFFTERCKQK